MIGKCVNEGFRFALSLKRLLPLFLLYTIFFYFLIYSLSSLIQQTFIFGISILIGAIFLTVAYIPINAALIHQAVNFPKNIPFGKSFSYGKTFFWRLIGAALILGIISFLVRLLPLFSFIISIIITLMFFFIQQSIVIGRLKIFDAFNDSFKIFKKFPLKVFVTWIVIILISSFIFILSIVPLGISFLSYFISTFNETSSLIDVTSASVPSINFLLKTIEFLQSPLIYVLILFITLGMSFSAVFSIGVLSRLYMMLKKSRKIK